VTVKRTILVVEDEKDIRELIGFHLEQQGYATREADTGEAALAQIATERPALVMLDIMLPGTDGLEVCRRLRTSEATQAIPIIMLTARAAEVDRVIGLEVVTEQREHEAALPLERTMASTTVTSQSTKQW
jgi:two-component system phosphate regulon response regulator PhoB